MTENIYDLANNLERAIRALPEYQDVLAAKKTIATDPDALAIWEAFVVAQNRLQDQVQQGLFPTEEEQQAFQEMGQKIEGNPLLKAYFDRQQRLYVYVADLERIIFEPLKELGED